MCPVREGWLQRSENSSPTQGQRTTLDTIPGRGWVTNPASGSKKVFAQANLEMVSEVAGALNISLSHREKLSKCRREIGFWVPSPQGRTGSEWGRERVRTPEASGGVDLVQGI